MNNICAAKFQTGDRSQTQLMRIKITTPFHKKAEQEHKKLTQWIKNTTKLQICDRSKNIVWQFHRIWRHYLRTSHWVGDSGRDTSEEAFHRTRWHAFSLEMLVTNSLLLESIIGRFTFTTFVIDYNITVPDVPLPPLGLARVEGYSIRRRDTRTENKN